MKKRCEKFLMKVSTFLKKKTMSLQQKEFFPNVKKEILINWDSVTKSVKMVGKVLDPDVFKTVVKVSMI